MCDLRAKMAAKGFTADEAVRFIVNISGGEDKGNEENVPGKEGGAEMTTAIAAVTIQ